MSYTPFAYTTCAICGKEFIRIPGSIYKVVFANKVYHCCGYKCWNIAKQTSEAHSHSHYRKHRRKEDK